MQSMYVGFFISFDDAKKEKEDKEIAKSIIKLGYGLMSRQEFEEKHPENVQKNEKSSWW
ncbi:hypothetical protein [Thermoactinomyces sp. CICC 10522]|uniref:hypothetical protein n=1 Tax=Thermoactinomyces sp. CICC 10522 TaxID=2767427 RepID=UPI0018DD2314|nr:hypothetical protein [Thermoactinomyces sp. CICC 10522]MBH8605915.1 hypothetical protein [Thermoactinomyces sp. CICC 10522]